MGMEVTLSPTSMNELVQRISQYTKKLVMDELNKKHNTLPKTLTVKEVAELLHISEWCVRQKKTELGGLKLSTKQSGKIIFPYVDILSPLKEVRFLDTNMAATPSWDGM